MNAMSLNHLWTYLQGLSLTASNQRWLGERLIEASAATEATANDVRISKHRHGLTDEELAACLAKYVPLTDADFPSLSQEDYADYLKNHSGRVVKGVEKWL